MSESSSLPACDIHYDAPMTYKAAQVHSKRSVYNRFYYQNKIKSKENNEVLSDVCGSFINHWL